MRYDAVRRRFDDPVEYLDVNLSLNYNGDLKKSVQCVSKSLLPKSMCLVRVLQHCIVLNDEEIFHLDGLNQERNFSSTNFRIRAFFNELFKLKHKEITKRHEKDEVSFLNESFNENNFVKMDQSLLR